MPGHPCAWLRYRAPRTCYRPSHRQPCTSPLAHAFSFPAMFVHPCLHAARLHEYSRPQHARRKGSSPRTYRQDGIFLRACGMWLVGTTISSMQ